MVGQRCFLHGSEVHVRIVQDHAVAILDGWDSKMNVEDAAAALCEAASEGDVDAIKMLLKNGVSPDAGDYDSRTALHLACAEGQMKVPSRA